MSIKGVKITENQIQYIFPRQIHSLRSFTSLKQLKRVLKDKWADYQHILPNFPYKWTPFNGMLRFKCSMCSNAIYFVRTDIPARYELRALSFQHIHGLSKDNNEVHSDKKVQVYQANDFEGLDKIIKNKIESLEVSSAFGTQKLKNSRIEEPNDFEELLKLLKRTNPYISYQPSDYKQDGKQYPDFLMIITKQMKEIYLKTARTVGYDFTYNLIRETVLSASGRVQYGIGFIAGLNSYRRICVYALIVATKQNKQFTEKAFSEFILHMGKQPESIVTDQSLGLLAGLGQIRKKGIYQGVNLLDTFHVLKNYKFRNRELKRHIMKMIREKCKHKFHCMYLEAIQMARTEEEMDAVHHFMHESSKFCISQIPEVFVGLGVSNSHNQALNHIIKLQLKIEVSYAKAINRILQTIEDRNIGSNLIYKEPGRMKDFKSGKQLHILKESVCSRIFQFFSKQVMRSCNMDLVHKQGDFFCIQDQHSLHYVTKIPAQQCKWFVRNSKTEHINYCFECSCKFQQKTGMPCQHVIKALWQTHHSFLDTLDEYWMIESPERLIRCYMSMEQQNLRLVKRKGRIFGKHVVYFDNQGKRNADLPRGTSTVVRKNQVLEPIEEENSRKIQMKRIKQKEAKQNQQKQRTKRISLMNNYFENDAF